MSRGRGLAPIMMILVVLRFGTAMAVIDEYLIFGGFNRASPTYTWTIFMYDQAFKLGLWRQGYAAAIGMIGAVAMMVVMAVPAPHLPAAGAEGHDAGGDRRRDRCRSARSAACASGWCSEPAGASIRHAVINFFMRDHPPAAGLGAHDVDQVASRRDAGAISGRRKFDFTHYGYVFEKIDTLPVNLFNSIYVTAGTVLITTVCAVLAGYALVHLRPRGGGVHRRHAAGLALFPDPRRLAHQHLRDPALGSA